MISWVVKTETAESTNQGPEWLLSEIKDVAYRMQLWSEPGSRYLIMTVVTTHQPKECSTENLTGLNNQPILC
jgi:hypothetical protein